MYGRSRESRDGDGDGDESNSSSDSDENTEVGASFLQSGKDMPTDGTDGSGLTPRRDPLQLSLARGASVDLTDTFAGDDVEDEEKYTDELPEAIKHEPYRSDSPPVPAVAAALATAVDEDENEEEAKSGEVGVDRERQEDVIEKQEGAPDLPRSVSTSSASSSRRSSRLHVKQQSINELEWRVDYQNANKDSNGEERESDAEREESYHSLPSLSRTESAEEIPDFGAHGRQKTVETKSLSILRSEKVRGL